MSNILTAFLALFLCSGSALAQQRINLEQERAALLQIHQTDRQAHFQSDADLLLRNSADEFISVSNGKINRESRDKVREFFKDYFNNAKYYEWDDLEPPIIKVSADASMAWMIVRTKVRRAQRGPGGQEREISFVYAGIMTYEKQNGKWARVANVSTFE
ncbi:MAG TPA: hypothetical protein VFQ92_16820 [Blastocatellia bacterium]|nr:hypothetical protein [Blastocatellia bacterium]